MARKSKPAEETMGQLLQRFRQAANLSQSQLARQAKVPVGTLRNWEQDRRIMRLDVARKIARILGVTLDQLAGPDEEDE